MNAAMRITINVVRKDAAAAAAVSRDLVKITNQAKNFNKAMSSGMNLAKINQNLANWSNKTKTAQGRVAANQAKINQNIAAMSQRQANNLGKTNFRINQNLAAMQVKNDRDRVARNLQINRNLAAMSARNAKAQAVAAGKLLKINQNIANLQAKGAAAKAAPYAAINNNLANFGSINAAQQNKQQKAAYAAAQKAQAAAAAAAQAHAAKWNNFQPPGNGIGWNKNTMAMQRWGSALSSMGNRLTSFGKNVQWTGRQLEFRFTLPIIAAGVYGFKALMDIREQATRLNKVYGDLNMTQEQITKETRQIATANRLLSDLYGVQQAEVVGIAADWAAAGSQGGALIKRTEQTLQTMILGEMDAVTATRALITVTQAYQLSVEDMGKALNVLNVVENETAVTLPDLIESIQDAGGVARQSGVDLRHLAAMTAALVPAAGTASEAGNSLKSIISRIMAPTKEAADAFAQLGVNVNTADWQSKNFTQRLETLSDGYDQLSESQKVQWARDVAQLHQIARLEILLKDMSSAHGNYAKALDVSANAEKNLFITSRELQKVMDSDPKKFQKAMVRLQNAFADAIIPLIPAILAVAGGIARLARAFADLDPATQTFILFGLVALAAIGPILSYVGAMKILLGTMISVGGGIFKIIAKVVGAIVAQWAGVAGATATGMVTTNTLTATGWTSITATNSAGSTSAMLAAIGPWAILIAAAVALSAFLWYIFRDEIGKAISYAAKALGKLPGVFVQVFKGIIQVLGSMIRKVVDLLSYLNPFARHSPSLVDNVIAGVDLIAAKYKSLEGLGNVFRHSTDAFKNFQVAAEPAAEAERQKGYAETRAVISAYNPGAEGAVDALIASIGQLRVALKAVTVEYLNQQRIVDSWEAQLKAANDTLDAAQDKLEGLREKASKASEELADAKSLLDDLYNTPIEGMGVIDDQMFENEIAIKKLRLEIMKLEDAGESADDLADRMARLNGEIEGLRGRELELIRAGAGSDVLGPIRDRISGLEDQRKAIKDQKKPLDDLQKQLDKLNRQNEIMDLEKAIKFDPLTRQIDKLKNSLTELPFDVLYARIQAQKGTVDTLTKAWEEADQAVKDQEATVKTLTAARDAVAATYDIEKMKLDELALAYDGIEQQISEMEAALSSFAEAAKELSDAAEAGDYEIPGGSLLPEDGDIQAEIDRLQKELDEQLKNLDLKKMFEKVWDDFTAWFGKKWAEFESWTKDAILRLAFWMLTDGADMIISALIWPFATAIKWIMDKMTELVGWMRENVPGLSFVMDTVASGVAKALDYMGNTATLLKNTWTTVFGELKNIISGMGDFVGSVFDGAADGVRIGVNAVLSAINFLIRGVNKVSSLLNLSIKIDEIPMLGTGGGGRSQSANSAERDLGFAAGTASLPSRRVGAGFVTQGARAIVGEGNPNYPEFVIPTDPRHRKRAMALQAQLGNALMARGGIVPQYGVGGIIDDLGGAIDTAIAGIGDVGSAIRSGAVTVAFAPFLKAFDLAMSPLPDDGVPGMAKGIGMHLKNNVYNWAKGAKNGALVYPTAGGSYLNVGEGGQREAVVPLPNNLRIGEDGLGGRTINFYGDLSFPNVTNGDDAEEFLRNLESLASD